METKDVEKESLKYSKSMKNQLTICFFLLGIINHLGTILVMTGSRLLSYELGLSKAFYLYTSASTLFNILTRFINSKYLVHISYKRRIQFLCFWMSSGYLLMAAVLLGYNKVKDAGKGDKYNVLFFSLSLIPSFILGTSYALGESAILAYLSKFPKNLVGGFSSGTGLSGLFSASLNFLSQFFDSLKPTKLYGFLSPLGPIYLFLFILTEKIYNKANSDHKFGHLLDQDEYETQTNQNINSVDSDDNKNTDDDSTKKNKPMSLENINYVFKCVGRIIINLFLIYLSQFYTLNAMIVKNVARTDIKLFLPLKCSREVGGHFYRSGKYEFLLIFFQIGMFTSKSMLFIAKKIQPIEIYTCSILCILTFFMLDYFLPFCNFYFFFPLVFLLGMLAGGTYVAAFYSILSNESLGEEYKDVSVNCATIANDCGTFLSGIIGIIIGNTILKNEKLFEKFIQDDKLKEGINCCKIENDQHISVPCTKNLLLNLFS